MADFAPAFAKMLADEGGLVWSNRAADRGGETFAGIARKFHEAKTAELWAKIDALKKMSDFPASTQRAAFQSMVRPYVEAFYRAEFWDAMGLYEIEAQSIAGEIFDTSVNTGKKMAAVIAQRAVNACNFGSPVPEIVVDGKFGPRSRQAINTLAKWSMTARQALAVDMNIQQGILYRNLIEADPSQRANYRGWITKRVAF